MKLSFSKNRRLKNKEIQLLLKKPKKIDGQKFVLYARKNQFPFCRSAIAISRRTVKLSSKRNLLRRRIKASLAQAQRGKAAVGGYDILITTKTKGPFAYKAIEKEIFGLLKKLT